MSRALIAVRRSSAHRSGGAGDLGSFLREAERDGPVSLVLFVPPEAPAVVEHAKDILATGRLRVRVVIGVDGLRSQDTRSLLAQLAFASDAPTQVSLAALQQTLTAYRRMGAEVVVVDRESGRILGESHLAHVAQRGVRPEVAA